MPTRPDVICAGGCGKLLWRGTGTLPPGESTCHECRSRKPKMPRRREYVRKSDAPLAQACDYCGTIFYWERQSATCSTECQHKRKNRIKHENRTEKRKSDPVYKAKITERRVRQEAKQSPEAKLRAALHRRLKRYGISEAFYNELAERGCGICGMMVAYRAFDLDHNHNCCERGCRLCFRGLLCPGCNMGIGNLHDDPLLLDKAKAYLEAAL